MCRSCRSGCREPWECCDEARPAAGRCARCGVRDAGGGRLSGPSGEGDRTVRSRRAGRRHGAAHLQQGRRASRPVVSDRQPWRRRRQHRHRGRRGLAARRLHADVDHAGAGHQHDAVCRARLRHRARLHAGVAVQHRARIAAGQSQARRQHVRRNGRARQVEARPVELRQPGRRRRAAPDDGNDQDARRASTWCTCLIAARRRR